MPESVLTGFDETADLLAWRAYGTARGATEIVLEANPGLADYGPILPPGLIVVLPDVETTPEPSVKLYD